MFVIILPENVAVDLLFLISVVLSRVSTFLFASVKYKYAFTITEFII